MSFLDSIIERASGTWLSGWWSVDDALCHSLLELGEPLILSRCVANGLVSPTYLVCIAVEQHMDPDDLDFIFNDRKPMNDADYARVRASIACHFDQRLVDMALNNHSNSLDDLLCVVVTEQAMFDHVRYLLEKNPSVATIKALMPIARPSTARQLEAYRRTAELQSLVQ